MLRHRIAVPALVALLGVSLAATAAGQAPPRREVVPGQFFQVAEPIDQGVIETVRASALATVERAAGQGVRPVLIFEFLPGDAKPGQSSFGAASDLADFLVRKLSGARKTVAFVPEPISGYALLPILACDEIVLGPNASLGPITPRDEAVTPARKEAVRDLARNKGRDPDLLLGLLDPEADLREVRTADRQTHYVLAENLPEFRKRHQVAEDNPAWEGAQKGVLTADRARQSLVRLKAETRAEVAEAYGLASASDDPTLGGPVVPLVLPVKGRLDAIQQSYLLRRIAQAGDEKVNLLIFEINSEGGLDDAASKLAGVVARLKGIKTVAYLDDRALGVSALIPLACDEIVFRKGARMGDVTRQLVGDRDPVPLEPTMAVALAREAEDLARLKGHPAAVARALVDPRTVVHQARDKNTGTVVFIRDEDIQEEPGRYEVLETPKSAEGALTVTDETARALGLSTKVVRDFDELRSLLGLRGKALRRDVPTWVDSLVAVLNTPWMKGLLLFVGFFMLVLELKLPGIGLPAIASALAFLLYFWSSYLGGTADQLEILLFLVGIVCLALELFVFPGYGVFGMSGVLLVLVSVVMASHTFVWPTQEYEYRQMGRTLIQVLLVLGGVIAGAVVFGRYFPSMPFFNRMVLKAEPYEAEVDPTAKPAPDSEMSYFFLIGETGRTTTVLKPVGKARFGELLVDVTADGFYIEAGRLVEVVEVQGSRVIVKPVA